MDDIQFGDVQEAKPETHLRPDRDAHFAVAGYENPSDKEIPVFLDLDVMLDMEEHAASDKSVELGGVLLGGQFHDEQGKPFVVITDSLRAKHYESTKGSFKFTKEAWTEITKERNEFSPDLQMVGWYHTHPDWGVFLSGMDMFICDNFFNRPLDMAYVIDPCRGDRAFFQWTSDPRDRCKRQRGFYVTTSRYRAAELEAVVARLPGAVSMPIETRSGGYGAAPIINVTQPAPPPRQENLPLLGIMVLQVCLLGLLVWKMFTPPEPSGAEKELAKITEQLETIAGERDAAATQKAVVQVLDTMLAEREGNAPGTVEKLTEAYKERDRLAMAARGHELRTEQLDNELKELNIRFSDELDTAKRVEKDLRDDKAKLTKEKEDLTAQLAKYKPAKKKGDKDTETAEGWSMWWIGAGIGVVVVAVSIIGLVVYKPTDPDDVANERLTGRPMRDPAGGGSSPSPGSSSAEPKFESMPDQEP